MADVQNSHPKFPNFLEVSSIDVDAGSIWIGDGCYVLKDNNEARPKDLGDNWHGICDRFFKRSGYNDRSREFQRWANNRDNFLHEHTEWRNWLMANPRIEGVQPEHQKWNTPENIAKRDLIDRIYKEFEAANPFTPTTVDKGFASFQHDGGHDGMGVMISTFYGDGSYPVYIEYGEGGRPRRVLIDFDPGGDDETVEEE